MLQYLLRWCNLFEGHYKLNSISMWLLESVKRVENMQKVSLALSAGWEGLMRISCHLCADIAWLSKQLDIGPVANTLQQIIIKCHCHFFFYNALAKFIPSLMSDRVKSQMNAFGYILLSYYEWSQIACEDK